MTSWDYSSAVSSNAQKSLDWLSCADKDYLAARRLLLDNLLVQGTSLANTALEKYLKAILAAERRPIPRIHAPLDLYRKIKPGGTLCLNEEFLCLLEKAYQLRYLDDLEPGYNIVLSQATILIALDEAVFEITKRFRFDRSEGRKIQRLLDVCVESRDARVVHMNVALGEVTKEIALNTQSRVYEIRIMPDGAVLEVEYSILRIDDLRFDRAGFVPINERQFQLAFEPIKESH